MDEIYLDDDQELVNNYRDRENGQVDTLVSQRSMGLANKLYDWMWLQKYDGVELLHPAVCCDHAGKSHFIKEIAKIIESG